MHSFYSSNINTI